MGNGTAQPSAESKPEHVPLDVPTMRETAARLLDEDAELPSLEEVETLTLLLRGRIMVAIPEIEAAAGKLPEDDVPRACASINCKRRGGRASSGSSFTAYEASTRPPGSLRIFSFRRFAGTARPRRPSVL